MGYVKGFADIVQVLEGLLRCQQIPTVAAIMRVLSPFSGSPGQELGLSLNKHFVSHFFGMGGKVEHVSCAVIDEAMKLYAGCLSKEGLKEGLSKDLLESY